MKRVHVRVNDTMHSFVNEQAKKHHGGNASDYIKHLISKDMDHSNSPDLSNLKFWRDKIDIQIAEMQEGLAELLGVKKDIVKKIEKATQPPQ